MSHWALVDENNIVINVTVGKNDDSNGDEGYLLLTENMPGRWIKTSYNTHGGIHLEGGIPLRKNYAGIGYTYREDLDAFIPPKPYDSWTLNEDTCLWEAPVEFPSDGNFYRWDEDSLNWIIIPV